MAWHGGRPPSGVIQWRGVIEKEELSFLGLAVGNMADEEKFWWEEGYKLRDGKESSSSSSAICRNSRQEIHSGEEFLQHTIEDTSNTLMGIFSDDSRLLVTLVDAGKALGSTVDVYQLSSDQPTVLRKMTVDEKCGYLSLSSCQTLLAVGVLKEDRVMIMDFETGELLVNLNGGCKSGFFGSLHFSTENRNTLLEQRIIRQTSAGPQQSIYRLWDLGFKPTSSGNDCDKGDGDEDDEEDEVETKIWEVNLRGSLAINLVHSTSLSSSSPLIYLTHEQSKQVQSIDFNTGKVLNNLKFGRWTSKGVISKHQTHLMAVAHFGDVSIIDISNHESFKVIKTISSPVVDDKYPLIPLAFLRDYGYDFLVCRINYDRTLIIFSMQDPSVYLMVKNLGGTISDATVITPDGKRLICWPFGSIEVYNLQIMIQRVTKKVSLAYRWQILYLRELFKTGRCKLVTPLEKETPAGNDADKDTRFEKSAFIQKVVQMQGHPQVLMSILQYL